MSQAELAAYVHSRLREEGIDVVLTGGAAVSIHTSNRYVSHDVDFVATGLASRTQIKRAMERLGFREVGRHFEHPDSKWFVEFPGGPPSVGMEPITHIEEMRYTRGTRRGPGDTGGRPPLRWRGRHWRQHRSLQQACL